MYGYWVAHMIITVMKELARKTLALHRQAISDPDFTRFKELTDLCKGKLPHSMFDKPKDYRKRKLEGTRIVIPIVQVDSSPGIPYSKALASIAGDIQLIIRQNLMSLNQSKKRINLTAKEFKGNSEISLVDVFLDGFIDVFVHRYCETLKSLDHAEKIKIDPLSKFRTEDDGITIYKWREITLRALNCLLLASPKISGLGKLIVKKVLEDKDVLEIVKQQFSRSFVIRKALMDEFHTDYRDFLKSNRWNKGFGNILDELSKENQSDVIARAIKHSAESFVYFYEATEGPEHAEVLKILQFLAFLHDDKAIHILAEIRNQSTESIARFLIRAVSISIDFQRNTSHYSNCFWSFLYYITELLLADQKSKFRELYKIEIENNCLIEKLGLLRKITELRNKASKFSPKGLKVQHIKKNEVWKKLKEEEVADGFKAYFEYLERLEKDIEAHNSQLSKYVKSFMKTYSSYRSLDMNDREESMRAMLGFWIREVGNFIGNKNRTIQLPLNMAQVSREEHFPILQKAKEVVDETKKKNSKRHKKGNST
ncbi:hypothetical protein BY996DRAFT_6409071 [Phakopsora pachyrhizi]|nr:hypothetical protein BY996DRAFT_6409071 [Phakopsora pachyrhizi]